jgi:hypothetical protein
MSKASSNTNDKSSSNEAPAAPTAAIAPPVTDIVPAAPASMPAQLDPDGKSLRHLAVIMPHIAAELAAIQLVRREEVDAALVDLPGDLRDNFMQMLIRMNPKKPGMHVAKDEFKPVDLRINSGQGKDPILPPTCPKGGVYSSQGEMILVPHAVVDNFKGATDRMAVTIIGYYEGRQFWPPRDEAVKAQLPPSLKAKADTGAPFCSSMDRVHGTEFGECQACPYLPFRAGKPEDIGCGDATTLYLMRGDLGALYRVTLTKTGLKATKPIRAIIGGWQSLWSGQFFIETTEASSPSYTWNTWKFSLAMRGGEPLMNSPAAMRVLELFSRKIETELYYPQMAATYARKMVTADAAGGAPADMSAIESASVGMDYSQNI